MNCILKRFILKKVNEILNEKKKSISACKAVVDTWQARAQLILDSIKSLSAKLDDTKLDEQEIDSFVAELRKAIESW